MKTHIPEAVAALWARAGGGDAQGNAANGGLRAPHAPPTRVCVVANLPYNITTGEEGVVWGAGAGQGCTVGRKQATPPPARTRRPPPWPPHLPPL